MKVSMAWVLALLCHLVFSVDLEYLRQAPIEDILDLQLNEQTSLSLHSELEKRLSKYLKNLDRKSENKTVKLGDIKVESKDLMDMSMEKVIQIAVKKSRENPESHLTPMDNVFLFIKQEQKAYR